MSTTIAVTIVVMVLGVALAVVFGRRRRRIRPARFAVLPAVAVIGVAAVAPQVDAPALAYALLPVGALVGLAIGYTRGAPRFTDVEADDEGRVVYRESPVGLVVLVGVLVVHELVDALGHIGPALAALVMLALGVGAGETAGFHLRVYRRFRAFGAPATAPPV